MTRTNELGQRVGKPVDWTHRPSIEPVRLVGRYVEAVPLSSAHYAELFQALCGPEDGALWTYRVVEPPANLAELWMHLAAVLEAPGDVTLALVPQEGEYAGQPAGLASYLRVDPANGSAEVGGIVFARALQRTRAATEAMYLMARHVFDDLGYRRYEWKCDDLNEPSRRAAERLGFTYEGTFRQHQVYKGRNRDTAWFAITDDAWPGVRERLERWLDPANFDDEGSQRASLWDRRPG